MDLWYWSYYYNYNNNMLIYARTFKKIFYFILETSRQIFIKRPQRLHVTKLIFIS